MPVWDENRGRQNCDGSRADNADRLLIRPASGRQAGTGLSDRTHHWKDTAAAGHSKIESQAKSTDTNLTNTPDGTRAHSQFGNVPRALAYPNPLERSAPDAGRFSRREIRRRHPPLAQPLLHQWAQTLN